MDSSFQLLSPKQVARAIGVSESSLKRWCDQGWIQTVRTVGGHRKMLLADVLRFVRERQQPLVSPEVLGLPPVSDHAELGLARAKPRLVEALLGGDELLARQVVFDLHLAKHSWSVIFDDVVAAAFHEIGDRWACQHADVYQERRSCEIMLRILVELRKVQREPDRARIATGGTIAGDFYALPSAMAELVLREVGFQATGLGHSIPLASLARAVEETQPDLFWLSVSHVPDTCDFAAEFTGLSRACSATGTALVVGGRALTQDLRHRMTYAAFCDTMQQLEAFAIVLIRSLRRTQQAADNLARAAARPADLPARKRRKKER